MEDGGMEEWNSGRFLLLQRCKNRALACLKDHEYSRAFAHFLIALTVQPSVKGELLNAFLFTLEKLVENLEKEKQVNEILMCYEQALEVLPQDSHILHGLATVLFRFGYVECALSYFLKSYQANPFFTPSLYCMENLKNALVERWHFLMLNDSKRNLAYKSAIQRAIQAGHKQVLDVGAGTGILSLMASDSGADAVYACEASEIMFSVLQNVVELNNKPITLFHKLSMDLRVGEELPEKVSLVVTEIFDAGLFGENSLETLNHVWEQLLKSDDESDQQSSPNGQAGGDTSATSGLSGKPPRAKIIPQCADVFVVPVECERFRKSFRLDDEVKHSLEINGNVVPQCLDDEPYSSERIDSLPCNYKFLSAPTCILRADFNSPKDIKSLLEGRVLSPSFKCTDSGHLDAFVMWFDLHLDEKETISTRPGQSSLCCWEQAVFYALPHVLNSSDSHCNVGDAIETEFLCRGCLQLQKIALPSKPLRDNDVQNISMDPSLIYSLNAHAQQDVTNLKLTHAVDNATVLDISSFPFLGLKSLMDSSGTAHVLRSPYQTEVEQIRDARGLQRERLQFRTYEDLCNSKLQADFLVVDPVEMCGLLRKNLLEDVAMLRMQCLKDTGSVFPGEIEIHGVLVESETLNEYSKLVSDERVDGYKISQVMNAYKCQIHQDINFSKLAHRKLSDPFKLCKLDLNSPAQTAARSFLTDLPSSAEVRATGRGRLTAVVYWFRLRYRSDVVLDTAGQGSLWRQAAFVLDEDVDVEEGETLHLQYGLKNSCFRIGVVKP